MTTTGPPLSTERGLGHVRTDVTLPRGRVTSVQRQWLRFPSRGNGSNVGRDPLRDNIRRGPPRDNVGRGPLRDERGTPRPTKR